ncbi:MAG: hypothetical protein R3A10_02760 [Caldilineaceae bacterium]
MRHRAAAFDLGFVAAGQRRLQIILVAPQVEDEQEPAVARSANCTSPVMPSIAALWFPAKFQSNGHQYGAVQPTATRTATIREG